MQRKVLRSLILGVFVLTAFFNVKTADACACGEMDPMYMTNYKFYYSGQIAPKFTENQDVPIYKKIRSLKNEQPEVLKMIKDGLFDKSKLTNLNVQSLNLIEDKDFGYSIYVDFLESTISFNEYWEKWQRNYEEPFPYTIKNFPTNEEIIKIADQFAKDYSLNLQNFGKPFVQENIQKMYKESPDKANFYIPEMVNVVYPILLNGKEVYDDGGYQNGLNITVDLRLKKVSGVWNLSFASFEESTLKAETDQKVIKKMIQDGGLFPIYFEDQKVKTKTLTLGTPKEIYLKTYKYENLKSTEVYVPALLFPIQNTTKERDLYKQNVVVPLVKINEENTTVVDKPMPLPVTAVQPKEEATK